jgi:hypothetical protein
MLVSARGQALRGEGNEKGKGMKGTWAHKLFIQK